MTKKIFDVQVNYGRSAVGPDCDIQTYLRYMQKRVSKVLLIPSPSHDHTFADGAREISCIWEYVRGTLVYSAKTIKAGVETVATNPTNPYQRFNTEVIAHAANLTRDHGIDFLVAVKCHPRLDTQEHLERLVQAPEVRAIKIHGLATHSGPGDVPSWLPGVAREANVPFFIHTDYHVPVPNPTPMQQLMQDNTGSRWYSWMKKHQVRALLAHGLRLDVDILEKIRDDPDILIGVGPVSLIENESERLMVPTDNYLKTLLTHTSASNIAFCTDYRWNVWRRDAWDDFDWTSDERLAETARKIGLGATEITGMLHDNAARFFTKH